MHLSFSWSGFLRNTLCNKELNASCVKRRCGVRHVREKSKVYSVTQITMWAMTLGPKGRQCGTHTELQLSHPRCTDFGYLSTNPLSGEPIEVLQEGCWASALSAATRQWEWAVVPKESPLEKKCKSWQLGCTEKISAQGIRACLPQWQHLLRYMLIHGQLTFQTSERCHDDISS